MTEHASEVIMAAIQSTHELEDAIEGGLCVGFVTIAEWVSPDGNRWLTHMCGGPSGPGLPQWQVRGYLHEALFYPGDDEPDD